MGTSALRLWCVRLPGARAVARGLASLALFTLTSALAQEPMLRPAQSLQSGGQPLKPGSYAIPCVTDWNGDGKKDLIVGYRYADKIALFLNLGTDAAPAFAGFTNLQARGADIYQPGAGCGAPAPWVCDYDSDGKRDLLVGNGTDGKVYFYRNEHSDAQPVLAPAVGLLAGGSALSVGWRATPFVCDWDGDGKNDLLVGNGDGLVYYFRNSGTPQAPVYLKGELLQAGGTNLNLGIRAVPRACDWDGDGRTDLVGSSNSGVYWCRNLAASGYPVLAAPLALRVPGSNGGLAPMNTGSRMRLDLTDWNNDGVMDILLGNADGIVSYFEAYRFEISALTFQSDGTSVLGWSSAPFLRYQVFAGTAPDNLRPCATNLPSGGNASCWTNDSAGPARFFRIGISP